jgi:hypothetical protein
MHLKQNPTAASHTATIGLSDTYEDLPPSKQAPNKKGRGPSSTGQRPLKLRKSLCIRLFQRVSMSKLTQPRIYQKIPFEAMNFLP